MAYTYPWTPNVPTGTQPANQLDTFITDFKKAVAERLVGAFDIPDFAADPLVLRNLTLTQTLSVPTLNIASLSVGTATANGQLSFKDTTLDPKYTIGLSRETGESNWFILEDVDNARRYLEIQPSLSKPTFTTEVDFTDTINILRNSNSAASVNLENAGTGNSEVHLTTDDVHASIRGLGSADVASHSLPVGTEALAVNVGSNEMYLMTANTTAEHLLKGDRVTIEDDAPNFRINRTGTTVRDWSVLINSSGYLIIRDNTAALDRWVFQTNGDLVANTANKITTAGDITGGNLATAGSITGANATLSSSVSVIGTGTTQFNMSRNDASVPVTRSYRIDINNSGNFVFRDMTGGGSGLLRWQITNAGHFYADTNYNFGSTGICYANTYDRTTPGTIQFGNNPVNFDGDVTMDQSLTVTESAQLLDTAFIGRPFLVGQGVSPVKPTFNNYGTSFGDPAPASVVIDGYDSAGLATITTGATPDGQASLRFNFNVPLPMAGVPRPPIMLGQLEHPGNSSGTYAVRATALNDGTNYTGFDCVFTSASALSASVAYIFKWITF